MNKLVTLGVLVSALLVAAPQTGRAQCDDGVFVQYVPCGWYDTTCNECGDYGYRSYVIYECPDGSRYYEPGNCCICT